MATVQWTREDSKYGVVSMTATLAAGDSSADLILPDYSDKTVHVYGGTFGDSAVSVKGLNATAANAQDMHRVNDPTLTFSSLTTEIMALLLENPKIIRASASGTTGTGLKVTIVSKRNL